MTILKFDPERVELLFRSLEDLRHRIDTCARMSPPDELAELLVGARASCDVQLSSVESALREISSHRRNGSPTCQDVHEVATKFGEWGRRTHHWWTQATTQARTRGDDLLRTLRCSGDPKRYGELIDSLDSLEYLVLGTADLSELEDALMQATDPDTTPSHIAGRRIRRILDVVFESRAWEKGLAGGSVDVAERSRRERALRELVARVSAPWQLHFVVAEDWEWTPAHGVLRLHQLAHLESAADELLEALPAALLRSMKTLPEDSSERLQRIDSIAHAVGAALEVRRMSEIRRADVDSGIETLHQILSTLSIDGPWPISVLVDAGARWIGDYFDTTESQVRTATLDSLAQREVLASIAVVAVWNAARTRTERRPADPNLSPSEVPFGLPAELRATYQAIDNAAGKGQALAQITAP